MFQLPTVSFLSHLVIADTQPQVAMVIADAREAIRGGRRGGEARRSVERGDLRRNICRGDARKSIESRISRKGPAKNIDN